jgi:hypothetical protein
MEHLRTGRPDFVWIVVTSDDAKVRLCNAFAEEYFASTS